LQHWFLIKKLNIWHFKRRRYLWHQTSCAGSMRQSTEIYWRLVLQCTRITSSVNTCKCLPVSNRPSPRYFVN